MRPHTTASANEIINRSYGNRIDLASQRSGFTSTRLFYCHACENWFHQAWRSIKRGTKTRCECNYKKRLSDSAPFDTVTGAGKKRGHRCIPEWECYDRVPPCRR